jgi:hypothetical protein
MFKAAGAGIEAHYTPHAFAHSRRLLELSAGFVGAGIFEHALPGRDCSTWNAWNNVRHPEVNILSDYLLEQTHAFEGNVDRLGDLADSGFNSRGDQCLWANHLGQHRVP